MKRDIIANGVVWRLENRLTIPVVVRLAGTNVELGQQILQERLAPIPASDMADGAQKIVAAISEMN